MDWSSALTLVVVALAYFAGWWCGRRRPRVITAGWSNHPHFVKADACPIGTIVYTHCPKDKSAPPGLYRCVGYANEVSVGLHQHVDIIGELILATDFGYPDDGERGFFLEAILNGKRMPYRGTDGGWRI